MGKHDSSMTLRASASVRCRVGLCPTFWCQTGLINNAEFESFECWDVMLKLIQQRRDAFQNCSNWPTRTHLEERQLLRHCTHECGDQRSFYCVINADLFSTPNPFGIVIITCSSYHFSTPFLHPFSILISFQLASMFQPSHVILFIVLCLVYVL